MTGRLILSAVAAALALACLAGPASGAVYNVNTTSDPAGAGCTGGTCSLRQAVGQVNGGAGTGDTINIPTGHYTYTQGVITAQLPVTITGEGARSTTIDAASSSGVFSFDNTSAPSFLSGVTITGGRAGQAAGIFDNSTLTITDSAIVGNVTTIGAGGGIYVNVNKRLTLDRSLVSGNEASQPGGGIYNLGTLAVTNTTIANNTANKAPASFFQGGGIDSGSGIVTLTSVTLAGNTAYAGGAIFLEPATTVNFKDTIAAGNTATGGAAANCVGPGISTSLGNNLEDGSSCNFTHGTDQRNTPPGLGPLQDNGGPTDTRALLPGSAAIDKGSDCPATDQRGVPRVGACDIGAFEFPPPASSTDTVAPNASDLALKPTSFAPLGSGGSIARKKKRKVARGATVSYKLSEAAIVTFTAEKKTKGRKKGRKCVAKRKRGKRCTFYKLARGSFTHAGKAGANSFKFSGRINGKKLGRGSYRLLASPTDAARNRGATVNKSFRVVRR